MLIIQANIKYCVFMKKKMKKNVAALENVNLLVLTSKVNAYISQNNLEASENNVRLVKMTLRHPVRHFPTSIPFIAAVRKCGERQVVFAIKNTKFALIDDIDVSSETNVGKEFAIDGVQYVQIDTINGYPRYKPLINH